MKKKTELFFFTMIMVNAELVFNAGTEKLKNVPTPSNLKKNGIPEKLGQVPSLNNRHAPSGQWRYRCERQAPS